MTNTLNDIKNLPSEDRYDYFLSLAAEERELWILVNDNQEFLKLHSDELNLEALPIWPTAELAEDYAQGASETLTAKSIALPQFFMKWIAGLEGDNLQINVFPNENDDAWLMEPSEFKREMQNELSSSF